MVSWGCSFCCCQFGVLMIETRNIETAPGMVFDVSVGGPEAGPLVLMLHGFCVSRHFWDNQIPALAAAGYFVLAPNQRGYAAGPAPIRRFSTTTGSTN